MIIPTVVIVLALTASAVLALNFFRQRFAATVVAACDLALSHYERLVDASYGVITANSLIQAIETANRQERRLLYHLLSHLDRIGKVVGHIQGQWILMGSGMFPPHWIYTGSDIYGISRQNLEAHQSKYLPKPT